jgi:hypothetical protein
MMTGLMHLAIWVLCLTAIFLLGFTIPIPLIGNLIGMLLLSFLLVFWVERQRLGHDRQAVHIALGAVLARVYMVLVKTGVALGMSFWLLWNLA